MHELNSLLETMTPLQRSIFAFHYLDRLGHAAVANALGVSRVEYEREWGRTRERIVDFFRDHNRK